MIINWIGGSKDVTVKDSSFRLRQVMGSNNVTLNFSLPEYVEFPLGSTIDFQAEEYTLHTPQTIKEVNSKNFEYSLVFGGSQEILKNYKIKDVENGLKFPFTAKPVDHLQLIVNVLNENGSGWSIGSCIDENEKLISYNHNNCYDALNTISSNFETEWEIVGKVISLHKVSYNENSPIPLSYGKGNGFKSGVGRKNDGGKSGFNKLFVQGGNRNIDFSVYGSKDLLLPKSQSFDYMGNTYNTDSDGLSIVRDGVAITNIIEQSLDSTHIYPKRIGTITEVVVVDAGNNFYDFKDSAIPAGLDYSTLRMEGEKITIYFESGKLAGREFDIEQSDTVISGYDHAERRFKLVPKEEDGFIMPNATFIPEVGDKYSVYGMMMPLAYISDNGSKTGASWTMFKEAAKHFYENEESKFSFNGELDGIWAKKDWLNIGGKIVAGGYVTFSDTEFQPTGVDVRIVSVRDYINNPYSPIIGLSNSVQGTSIASDLDEIKSNQVVIDYNKKRSIDFVRRYFKDAKETIKLLEAGQLNFGSAINPITVETMALLVGDKSLQFQFIDGNGNQTSHALNYDDGTKIFTAAAGTLQHLTLEIDAISPSPNYKEWTMASYVSAALVDPEKSYYLYAKVSKTLTTGVFMLSETAIGIEEVAGYYHLLTAIVNSEYQDDRSYATMYGFTEILSGQIKVDKLTSGNGLQVIELLSDQIRINAKVTFSNDSPAIDQIAVIQDPKITAAEAAAEAAAKSYADAQDVLAKVTSDAYADGIVSTAEANAIADATAKMNLAKAYADSQDALLKVTTDAYADGEITTLETAMIAVAQAKADLAQTNAEAHADGIVTAEEAARIAEATAKLVEAKSYADAQVDAVQVGGRNLLLNSEKYRFASPATTDFHFWSAFSLERGQTYTVSIGSIVKIAGTATNVSVKYYDYTTFSTVTVKLFDISSNTQYFTFDVLDNANNNALLFYNGESGSTTGNQIEFQKIKIEKGNKATDWTPAPEDLEERIDFLGTTKIDGNTVATGTMAVGNGSGVNAFVTGEGVGSTAIRFAAGSNWANRATSPFKVLDDGSLYATKGEIAGWLIAENALSKDKLSLNAVRAALEIYSASNKLSVDISGATTLSPLASSTLTPSATVITSSSTDSDTSVSGRFPAVFQNPIRLVHGSGVTFSGAAGDVVTLDLDLYQSSGTPYYSSSYVKEQGGATLTYEEEYCKIGVEITAPDSSKIYVEVDASHVGSVNGLTTFSLLKSLTLIAGTYTIRTMVSYSFYQAAFEYDGGDSNASVTVNVRTPKMTGLAITIDSNKTEIIAGGFQVIKSATQYLRADRNAGDTGTGNAWLTSGGWWYHTGTFTQTSDKRQKFNIKPFFVDLEKFKQLTTNEYDQILNPIDDLLKIKQKDIEIVESVGLMAQELELVMPKAVHDDKGVKSIDNAAVNSMLVNVLQQALKQIEELKEEVEILKKKK